MMTVKTTATFHVSTAMMLLAGAASLWAAGVSPAQAETRFKQTNLVSDGAVPAMITDADLVNAWGLAASSTSPFWVADNGTGVATIYVVAPDNASVTKAGLTVTIPSATGIPPSAPTGQVFYGGSGFQINGSPARFLFDSEDGAITAWNGGTTASIVVNNGGGAIYKGLGVDAANAMLFASDFHNGDIEVYDTNFDPVTTPGGFTDPNLPAGYAPFDLKVFNSKLYVTYAKQDDAKEDDDPGPGHGFVDVFDLNGALEMRLISGGALNSPWGLEFAPASFGTFAGDLLVGNFGDGAINAFDPTTGAFIDSLRDQNGQPIDITDLWALSLGNGGSGGGTDTLYFTAGLADEAHGLFGGLTAVPETSTWVMVLAGFVGLGFVRRRARRSIAEAM